VATTGDGIEAIATAIAGHREYMERLDMLSVRRVARERSRVEHLTAQLLHSTFWTPDRLAMLDEEMPLLARRERSPLEIAHALTGR
jgi:hypothetical protein